MLLYPEVQKRAQSEIDRVIGRDRLPEFSDRDSLPYITAITKEVLRYATNTFGRLKRTLMIFKMAPAATPW